VPPFVAQKCVYYNRWGRRAVAAEPLASGRNAMRRPPPLLPCLLLAGLLAAGTCAPRVDAQGTAAPDESPVLLAPLAFGRVPELPAAPVELALIRVSAAPDTSVDFPPLPGPVLAAVEQGAFAVHTPDQVKVLTPEMTGEPSQQLPTPGPDFTLEPDDILLAPDSASLTLRNTGTVSADALLAAIVPDGTPLPSVSQPGVTVRVLTSGVVDDVPTGRVMLVLGRYSLPPGASADRDGANRGPVLGYVEDGAIDYTLVQGQADIVAATDGTPTAASGTATTLTRGDGVVEETGAVGELRNESGAPASALFFLVTPVATALIVWAT
jgi:hypothetical protein